MKLIRALLPALLFVSCLVSAEPNVLFDSGRTISVAPYLESLGMDESAIQQPRIDNAFQPVRTPELSMGRVNKKSVNLPYLSSPIFLVGADRVSQSWLVKNKPALIKMGATGMIVNVDTEAELTVMARLSDGLQVVPAPASSVAATYKIKHYPVLITKTQITQ